MRNIIGTENNAIFQRLRNCQKKHIFLGEDNKRNGSISNIYFCLFFLPIFVFVDLLSVTGNLTLSSKLFTSMNNFSFNVFIVLALRQLRESQPVDFKIRDTFNWRIIHWISNRRFVETKFLIGKKRTKEKIILNWLSQWYIVYDVLWKLRHCVYTCFYFIF